MTQNHRKDLARYRMEKAARNLSIARENFHLGFYDEAVTKSYYTILTAMRALLALLHLDSKRHEGVITLFHERFIKPKLFPREFYKTIPKLKKLRQDADYGDFVEITKTMAENEIAIAERFLKAADEVMAKMLAGNQHSKTRPNHKNSNRT